MRNNQFYIYLYDTIDKIDGHDLRNTAHCECLWNKGDMVLAICFIERGMLTTQPNKTEHFNYKGKHAGISIAMHLKDTDNNSNY